MVQKKCCLHDMEEPSQGKDRDLSNPGKMCKGCLASFQRYYSLQEKLENHAVVLARIEPALASKRQMEPAPSSPSPKRQSVPPRPLACTGVGRWLELGG